MTRRFVLKARWGTTALAILFFGACAAVFIHLLRNPGGGVVINGILELGPGGARIFYGVLAATSLGFVVLGVFGTLRVATARPEVVIDDEAITIPKPLWRSGATTVRFADVRQVYEQNVFGQVFTTLVHPGGKASIAKDQIGEGYGELVALIHGRCRSSSPR